jgi:serine/threonine protein kinase
MTDPMRERAAGRVGTTVRGQWLLDALGGIDKAGAWYRARDVLQSLPRDVLPSLARDAAQPAFLSIQHLELSRDPAQARRFLREASITGLWAHPNVVRVLAAGATEDGAAFLAREWLDGRTCAAIAEQAGGRMGLADVLRVADAVLDALAAAHDRGLAHTNLRPDKVFWTQARGIRITGAGEARFFGGAAASATVEVHESAGGTRLVSATELVQPKGLGSTAFMPPEQARGDWDDIDARSDLWALGAVMFALLTGRPVRTEPSGNQQLLAAATRPAPPLSQVLPGVPPALAAVVDRALAFEPAARWPDARTMQRAVREALPAAMAAPVPPASYSAHVTAPPAQAASYSAHIAAPPAAAAPAGTVFGARPSLAPELPFARQAEPAPAPPAAAAPVPPAAIPGTVFGAPALRASVLPFASAPTAPAPAPSTPPPAPSTPPPAPTGTVFGARPSSAPDVPFAPPPPAPGALPPHAGPPSMPVAPPASEPAALDAAETPFSTGTVFGSRAALAVRMPFRGDLASPLAFSAAAPRAAETAEHAGTGTVTGAAAASGELPFHAVRGGAVGMLSADAFALLQTARWTAPDAFRQALERHGLDEVEWRLWELSLLAAVGAEARAGALTLATRLLDAVELAVTRQRLSARR